jgi:hypothetical protein
LDQPSEIGRPLWDRSRLIHAWKPWTRAGMKTPVGTMNIFIRGYKNVWKHGRRAAETCVLLEKRLQHRRAVLAEAVDGYLQLIPCPP